MCFFRRKAKKSEGTNSVNLKDNRIILEFKGDNSVLFSKYEYSADPQRELSVSVIVPPTHSVFLIKDGVLSEELSQGKYDVLLVKKLSAFKKEVVISTLKVIYVSKTARLQTLWGTPPQQRVKYIDPKLGFQIDVGCFGKMEVKVSDAKKFYLEIVASFGENFLTSDLQDFVRTNTLNVIGNSLLNVINNNNLTYTDFDMSLQYIQKPLQDKLKDIFSENYGLEVCGFVIENVNISEENEAQINILMKKQRARETEINDYCADRAFNQEKKTDEENDEIRNLKFRVQTAADRQKVNALDREEDEYETKKRHDEEDRLWDRQDKILDREDKKQDKILDFADKKQSRDADLAGKAMYYDAIKSAGWANANADKQNPPPPTAMFCSKCGNPYTKQDMYCPFCGSPTSQNNETVSCPKCHKQVSVKSKFCPYCGANVKRQ